MRKHFFNSIQAIGFVFFLILSGCSSEQDLEPDFLTAKDLLNESYGFSPKQNMDVYLPAGRSASTTPLLIYIHGGAWIDGDKSEFLQVRPILQQQFPGYAFVALNYRLFDFATGTNGISDQEKDIISALDYIESQLSDWKISDDFIISGASAGGHLALLHAFKNNKSDIKAAIAFFPPTDLMELYKFNNLTALGLEVLLKGTPSTTPSYYLDFSPINFVDSQDVPTIFFHGDLDNVVPISQSLLLKDALQKRNVRNQFTLVPGQGHGFTPETYAQLFLQAKQFIGEF